MRASWPVRPLVARRLRLPSTKDLVANRLLLGGVLRVDLAGVNQQRDARLLELLQVLGGLEERGMRDDGSLDDAVEREVEDVPRAEAVAGRTEGRDAFRFEAFDDLVERGARLVGAVVREPDC